jgi:hypothetical protein
MVGPCGQDTSTCEAQYGWDPGDVETGVQRHDAPLKESLLIADEEFGGFGGGGVSIMHDKEPSKMKLPAQTTTTVQDETDTKDIPTRPADTNLPEEEIFFMSHMQDDALRKNNSDQSSSEGPTVSFADPEFTAKEKFEDDSVSSTARPNMSSHRDSRTQQAVVESSKTCSSGIDLETGKEGAVKAQCAVVRAFEKSHWAAAT